jgi:hypothetical protein
MFIEILFEHFYFYRFNSGIAHIKDVEFEIADDDSFFLFGNRLMVLNDIAGQCFGVFIAFKFDVVFLDDIVEL